MKKILTVFVLVLILGIGTTVINAADNPWLPGQTPAPLKQNTPPYNDPAVIANETGRDSIPLAGGIQPQNVPDSSDLVFIPLTPCRILDTRNISGHIPGGGTANYWAWNPNFSNQGGFNGDCGVPQNGVASAIAVTLTATNEDGPGNLRAWPYGGTMPTASVLNYMPGVNIANTTILPICIGGSCAYDFSIYANVHGTDLVADVVGYFIKKTPTVLYNQAAPGGLSVPTAGSHLTSTAVCGTTAYSNGTGNKKAIIDGQLSMNASATNAFSPFLVYSTDGGTTWADAPSPSWVAAQTTIPSGGYGTSSVSMAMDLTPSLTYTFAIQYDGASVFTSSNSSCHLRVQIIDQ